MHKKSIPFQTVPEKIRYGETIRLSAQMGIVADKIEKTKDPDLVVTQTYSKDQHSTATQKHYFPGTYRHAANTLKREDWL